MGSSRVWGVWGLSLAMVGAAAVWQGTRQVVKKRSQLRIFEKLSKLH